MQPHSANEFYSVDAKPLILTKTCITVVFSASRVCVRDFTIVSLIYLLLAKITVSLIALRVLFTALAAQ